MKTGKLIVFSAPSGSGKTTLVHFLLSQALPLGFSISATSRTPRSNEQNGIDYNFMSPEQFQAKIKADEFLEYEEVYEKLFYGTLNSEVERLWKQEKHILFDIDVKGGMTIKQKYRLLAPFSNEHYLDGDVVKLVDTLDLGSSASRRGSSSLPVPTIKKTKL